MKLPNDLSDDPKDVDLGIRYLVEKISRFRRVYCPKDDMNDADDFQRDLDELMQISLQQAYRQAQAPFIAELRTYRNIDIDTTMRSTQRKSPT